MSDSLSHGRYLNEAASMCRITDRSFGAWARRGKFGKGAGQGPEVVGIFLIFEAFQRVRRKETATATDRVTVTEAHGHGFFI